MPNETLTNAEVEEILEIHGYGSNPVVTRLGRALLEERQMLAKLHEFGCEDCSAALPCEAAKRLRQAEGR